jgi:catechol 2,3-dioxygenase-like lactoylglutathione lyase family enzyme
MENSKASNMPAYPRAVDHVGVGVADIERAIRWYQEVLGFTLLMGPIEVRATDPGSNVHDVLGQDRNAYGIPHGPGKAKTTCPIFRWRQPRASVAAAASRLAQTLPPCFLWLPRFHISDCCLKGRRNGTNEWFGKWMSSGSGIAETTTNAKRHVPLR